MSAPRTFDHDEAARLRSEGATLRELAERYGVTQNGIRYAVDPAERARSIAYAHRWQRNSSCPNCGAKTTRQHVDEPRLCWDCASIRKAWTVAPDGRLRCARCTEWKAPDEFHLRLGDSQRAARGGRRPYCKPCERLLDAARKQRSRARKREAK